MDDNLGPHELSMITAQHFWKFMKISKFSENLKKHKLTLISETVRVKRPTIWNHISKLLKISIY